MASTVYVDKSTRKVVFVYPKVMFTYTYEMMVYKYERICFLVWIIYTCATTKKWFLKAPLIYPIVGYSTDNHQVIHRVCLCITVSFGGTVFSIVFILPPLMMFMEWSVGWSFFSSFHPVNSILSLAKLTDHHRMNYCLLINRSCVWSGMRFDSFCARILTKLPASLGPICMHYDTK